MAFDLIPLVIPAHMHHIPARFRQGRKSHYLPHLFLTCSGKPSSAVRLVFIIPYNLLAMEIVSYSFGSETKLLFNGSWLISAQFRSLGNGSNPANLASAGFSVSALYAF